MKANTGKSSAEAERKSVLVGVCRVRQLDAWPGYYAHPVSDLDRIDEGTARKVNELWLFQSVKKGRFFSAEYVGRFSRDELKERFGRPMRGRSRGPAYLLYRISPAAATRPSSRLIETAIVRTRDFAVHSMKIARELKHYLDSSDRKGGGVARRLPRLVAKLPAEVVRTCAMPEQLDFLDVFWPVAADERKNILLPLERGGVRLEFGDSLALCENWPAPTVIVSDGPSGVGRRPGGPETPDGLAEFYRPFLGKWYERSLPSTTLWFWNTEQGWANCHRLIEECGWEFRNCHVWNKGLPLMARERGVKALRKLPVVTEVCVQYVRRNRLESSGVSCALREWMRSEWLRTQLPLRQANVACGVRDAAARKYFAADHRWYFPPPAAFVRIAAYANEHGDAAGRPYFAKPGGGAFTETEWGLMRAKFHCPAGETNLWDVPAVRGEERVKGRDDDAPRVGQKPLRLMETIICASSDRGDVVWEPFGGLCTVAAAALRTGRKGFSAESDPAAFAAARRRIEREA